MSIDPSMLVCYACCATLCTTYSLCVCVCRHRPAICFKSSDAVFPFLLLSCLPFPFPGELPASKRRQLKHRSPQCLFSAGAVHSASIGLLLFNSLANHNSICSWLIPPLLPSSSCYFIYLLLRICSALVLFSCTLNTLYRLICATVSSACVFLNLPLLLLTETLL